MQIVTHGGTNRTNGTRNVFAKFFYFLFGCTEYICLDLIRNYQRFDAVYLCVRDQSATNQNPNSGLENDSLVDLCGAGSIVIERSEHDYTTICFATQPLTENNHQRIGWSIFLLATYCSGRENSWVMACSRSRCVAFSLSQRTLSLNAWAGCECVYMLCIWMTAWAVRAHATVRPSTMRATSVYAQQPSSRRVEAWRNDSTLSFSISLSVSWMREGGEHAALSAQMWCDAGGGTHRRQLDGALCEQMRALIHKQTMLRMCSLAWQTMCHRTTDAVDDTGGDCLALVCETWEPERHC